MANHMKNMKGKVHILTKADRIKGGKSKSTRKKMNARSTCSTDCPLFEKCPLSSAGLKYGVCYLNKDKYPRMEGMIEKLFSDDPGDFYKLVAEIIVDMMRITVTEDDGNVKTKKVLTNALQQLHDMKFGAKTNLDIGNKSDKPFKFEFVIVGNDDKKKKD